MDKFFFDCPAILDVGCGAGHFLLSAKNKTKNLVGIDLNKTSLVACKKAGSDVIICDVSFLPIKDFSFDGLFFSHVIEHIPEEHINSILIQFGRIAKKKLLVVTPTEHNNFWSEGHVVAYDKAKLTNALKKAGFEVLETKYDKCFMMGLGDYNIFLKIFNLLPFLSLKMNILAIATVRSRSLD